MNAHFSYCMNVHPANTYDELIKNLMNYAKEVQKKCSHIHPMGVELHVNHQVAKEILAKMAHFKDFLYSNDFHVFSINNFPLIDFHQKIVKDKVYLPNWQMPERWESTIDCANILAQISKPNETVNISTLAGAFLYHPHHIDALAEGYVKTAIIVNQINEKHQCKITLALEPEPQTTLDNYDSIITFFNQYLKKACQNLDFPFETLLSIVGLNVDTCHMSVIFESPLENIKKLKNENIPIFKYHITNAPRFTTPFTPEKIKLLQQLDEPKYLHQTYAKDQNGKIISYRDLGDFDYQNIQQLQEIRTHFHTPLYLENFALAQTTRQDVEDLLIYLKATETNPLFFVSETYTWPQNLPFLESKESPIPLVEGISQEVLWMMKTYLQ